MADFLVQTWDRLEAIFPENVFARAAIGGLLGYLVIEALRPEFAYNPNGQRRQDGIFPELFPGAAPPTATPWWIGPVAGGLGAVLLI